VGHALPDLSVQIVPALCFIMVQYFETPFLSLYVYLQKAIYTNSVRANVQIMASNSREKNLIDG